MTAAVMQAILSYDAQIWENNFFCFCMYLEETHCR